jgi:ribosomal protein S18 acetylase RimI-like enzyme
VLVRPLGDDERAWKVATLEATWGLTTVARLGELVDAADLPGFVAVDGDAAVGLLTYVERGDGIEVVTIEATSTRRGIGRALMDAVLSRAAELGVRRVWLVTTSDNDPAIALYRACGMSLARVVADGVAVSRRVKPSIPPIGSDELVFERSIG